MPEERVAAAVAKVRVSRRQHVELLPRLVRRQVEQVWVAQVQVGEVRVVPL